MEALFQNVLTASFHGSIVIAAVLVLRLLLKKTPKKFICMLWLLAGLRLLMPFEIQSDLSLQPDVGPLTMGYTQQAAPVLPSHTPAVPAQADLPAPEEGSPREGPILPGNQILFQEPVTQEKTTVISWPAVAGWVWLTVALGFGIYTLFSYLRLRRQVREAVKIPGGWECDRIETAFILGFIRPRIYIPMGMDDQTRKHILAHERTHLEKGDHWIKMLGFVALAVHWFNPLVWLAYSCLCRDIELACDERVIQFMTLQERKSYSMALLQCSAHHAHFAACPVAFGEVSVKHRIRSVLNYRRPGFWISLVGVLAILFVSLCLLTTPKDTEEAPSTPEPTESIRPVQTEVPETIPQTLSAIPEETVDFSAMTQEERALYRVEKALDDLLAQDHYMISFHGTTTEGEINTVDWDETLRKHGSNFMRTHKVPSVGSPFAGMTGVMVYEGQTYSNRKNVWSMADLGELPYEQWRDWFSWEGAQIVLAETEDVENAVRFTAYFSENGTSRAQEMEFYFREENGALMEATVRNTGLELADKIHMNLWFPTADKVLAEMASAAAGAQGVASAEDLALQEKLDAWGVYFYLDDDELTNRGAILHMGQYTTGQGSLFADGEYWIEKKQGNGWAKLDYVREPNWAKTEYGLSVNTTRVQIDWTDYYGILPAGDYRFGKNITCWDEQTHKEQTYPFYSEFTVRTNDLSSLTGAEEALERCYRGVEALKSMDTLHFVVTSEFGVRRETWWDQGNYYHYTTYPEDARSMPQHRGREEGMICRDGIGYETVREDPEDWTSDVIGWQMKTLDTTRPGWDQSLAETGALLFYERDNSPISFPQGIGKISDREIIFCRNWENEGDTEYTLMTYRFDEGGNLTYASCGFVGMFDTLAGIPTHQLEILPTNGAEVEETMAKCLEDLLVMPFSWEQAKAEYTDEKYNIRETDFANTAAVAVRDPVEAARRARKEYPNLEDFLSSTVSYDEQAHMWRVTFESYYEYQASYEYRDVYLDDRGITKLLVYEGPVEERK